MKAAVWVKRFGYTMVGLSVLLLVGLADLLPVDVWLWFDQVWERDGRQNIYFRIVPASRPYVLEWSLLAIGAAAIVLGSILMARQKR